MIPEPRYDCAIDAAMSVIEGRWKTVIMCKLYRHGGPIRYNQLMGQIEGISPRIFTLQLKEMERDGIVIRRVRSTKPKYVEYCLSERGLSLLPILKSLADWGLENMFSNMVEFDNDISVPSKEDLKESGLC